MSEAYAEPYDDMDEQEPQGRAPFDLMAAIGNPNLAFDLPDDVLARIGAKVVEEVKIDEDSRADWKRRYDMAMKLALQTEEAKNTPWPDASNVKYPLISTSAIQFNARAYPAIIDGPLLVKGAVKGRPDDEKDARADRIGKHMSFQLLEEMDDWEEDTDKLLMQLPIVGCAFRKTYYDPLKGYNCSHLVSAGDFIVNYWTKDLDTAPRATHVLTFYPYEVTEKMRSGLWLDVELGRPQNAANDDDAPFTFYEQARLCDLDEDGYPEPYTVTVEKETGRVVRIVARFDERGVQQGQDGRIARITPTKVFTKYGFIPAPDGSFYDIGFGTLLNALSGSINTALNQLFDAATLSNVGGGFIGGGVSLKSGNQAFRPGEWKKVDGGVGPLRDNIMARPTSEPSSVLFQLLGLLIDAAKDVTATQDILGGDAGKGTMPVGTVSALIEQGLKTFTAIVKRIHRALKHELGILYTLNGRYLEPEVYFAFGDDEAYVSQADYQAGDMDVVPMSDPNMATDMQRMQQAQFVMEIGKTTGAIPPRKVAEMALTAARVPDVEELLGPETPPQPNPDAIKAEADGKAKERELDIKAATAATDNALTEVQTEKAKLELMMMGPDVAAMIDQAVQAAIDRTLQRVTDGGEPQAGPGGVPGMDQPPIDQGVPGPPEGPAEPFGGPMESGPGDEPVAADQGPPDGGDQFPPMG